MDLEKEAYGNLVFTDLSQESNMENVYLSLL
jgi:hypothetical protein